MKRICLSIGAILFIFQIGIAQKYKVKRRTGAVLKDRKEVATVEGEISYMKKCNIKLFQEDELKLAITEGYWHAPYKEVESIIYYNLRFPESNEEINIRSRLDYINEKQIIRYVLAENGLHIYEDGFKSNEINQLKTSEVVTSIQTDTTKWNEILMSWNKHRKNHEVQIDYEKESKVLFKKIDSNQGQYGLLPKDATHIVYRKAEESNEDKYPIVGAISYRIPEQETFGNDSHDIQVFKRVDKPIDYLASKSNYVPLAYCDIDSRDKRKYISYKDGKFHTYLSFSDRLSDNEWRKRIQIILEDLADKEMI